MKYIYVYRFMYEDKMTLGFFEIFDGNNPAALLKGFVIEPPWKNNERNISCIPEGEYGAIVIDSPTFKRKVILLENVPDRSLIEWHPGNNFHHTKGCFIPGSAINDIDGDNYFDVTNSKKTMDRIISLVGGDNITIKIKNMTVNK